MSPAADAGPDLVRACLRKPVSRTPVWFMRQAGRSLPEYRAARGDGIDPRGHRGRRAGRRAHAAAGPPLRRRRRHPLLRHRRAAPRHRLRRRRSSPAAGPVVAEPFRRGRPGPAAPVRARGRRPVRGRDGPSWSAAELAGTGVALIGFAGAPFTVASYLVEGGPSRTFAKVKALMHGDPALWDELTERPGRHGRRLAAGPDRGRRAGRAALRQLGRLAVARRVRPLRAPRHPGRARGHRRPRRADHPLRRGHRRAARPHGVRPGPTSSGSTGGCRSTRPAAASGAATRCRATSTPRSASRRGRWSTRRRRGGPGQRRRDGTGPGHVFNLATACCPRPTRASWPRSSSWCTQRDRGAAMTIGVLVMAHGTPAEPGRDRSLLHAHPARPPARAGAAGRAGRPLPGHRRHVAARRAHPGPGRRAARRARAPGAGRYGVAFGAKHTDPLIEDAAAGWPRRAWSRWSASSSPRTRRPWARASTSTGRPSALGVDAVHAVGPWYGEPGARRAPGGAGTAALRHRVAGARRVIFTAHSLPERIRETGDPYPEQLEESARLVAEAAGLADWVVAWQSAGRTPEPWLGPDMRDEVRRLGARGRDRRRRGLPDRLRGRPPRGALRPRHRGGRASPPSRPRLRPHGVAQRRSGLRRRPGRRRDRGAAAAG